MIEDPPPLTESKQTPPRLDLRQAVPLIDEVIVRNIGGRVLFNVPVASEDAGDSLTALLLLDYKGEEAPDRLNDRDFDPGTLDDLDRTIQLEWEITSEVTPGCRRVTMLVSHSQNFVRNEIGKVIDKSDLAVAVWWANINPDPQNPTTLVNCPLATSEAGGN